MKKGLFGLLFLISVSATAQVDVDLFKEKSQRLENALEQLDGDTVYIVLHGHTKESLAFFDQVVVDKKLPYTKREILKFEADEDLPSYMPILDKACNEYAFKLSTLLAACLDHKASSAYLDTLAYVSVIDGIESEHAYNIIRDKKVTRLKPMKFFSSLQDVVDDKLVAIVNTDGLSNKNFETVGSLVDGVVVSDESSNDCKISIRRGGNGKDFCLSDFLSISGKKLDSISMLHFLIENGLIGSNQ